MIKLGAHAASLFFFPSNPKSKIVDKDQTLVNFNLGYSIKSPSKPKSRAFYFCFNKNLVIEDLSYVAQKFMLLTNLNNFVIVY